MRLWQRVFAGATLIATANAAQLHAQDADWQEVRTEIEQIFPLVKAQWKVERGEPLFVENGDEIKTLPAEDADEAPVTLFPHPLVQGRLNKLTPDQRTIYLRWLVGHELWHRRQYELVKKELGQERRPATVSNQQWECEADIMGSAYASQAQLTNLSLDLDESAQMTMRDALKEVRDAVDPKQTNPEAGSEYPNLEQRRTATRIGVSLGVLKRVDSPGTRDQPGARALIANLVSTIMMGEDPTFEQWLAKVCRRIVHSGDGVSAVKFFPAITQWNKSGDNSTVDTRLPVYNRADDPVRVFVQIATAAIKREELERGDTYYWNLVDAQNFSFVIQPNTFEDVVTHLNWLPAIKKLASHPDSEYMPALIAPGLRVGDPLVFYDAVRIPRQANIEGQSPQRRQLAQFLTELAADAVPGDRQYRSFANIDPNCDYEGKPYTVPSERGQLGPGSVSCKLMRLVAPFERGKLTKYSTGKRVRLSLYLPETGDDKLAKQQFDGLIADLRALYPLAQFTTTALFGKKAEPLDRMVSVSGLDKLRVSLSITDMGGDGEPHSYAIDMGISPGD
jgi:hypothetical protein